MISTYISILITVSVLVSSILIFISLKRKPVIDTEARWLSKRELGIHEERFSKLREVILIADKIDVPTLQNAKEFLIALIDNFHDGVNYIFLVPEKFENEYGKEITARYQSIIQMAQSLSEDKIPTTRFQLKSRPKDIDFGPDFPYLFYRFLNERNENEIVAYRGEDKGMGIANNYRRLEPEIAKSFLFSVLPSIKGISIESLKDYESFSNVAKVIRLDVENDKAKEVAYGNR